MNQTNYKHKELAAGRWGTFSFFSQMANIGSEIERALNWQSKNSEYSRQAAERALELLDLTISDPKNQKSGRLKELFRLRELVADSFFFENEYRSTPESWRNYFNAFAHAAVLER